MEKELDGRQDQETSKYRNGALLCSAHPEIIKDIAEIKDTMKEVRDYILLRKQFFQLILDNTFISGVVTGVILLLIAYFTVL